MSGGLAARFAAASAASGIAIATASAPDASRNTRRVKQASSSSGGFIALRALRGAFDGTEGGAVGAAAADQVRERGFDLLIGGMRFFLQQRGGGHDPAIDAVGALRNLFFEPSGLHRMGMFGSPEAGEGYDLGVLHRRNRQLAGAHRLTVDVNRAGAALAEAAAEAGIVQIELVAKGVEQR